MSRRSTDLKNVNNNYIILLDLDFSWHKTQVEACKTMWKKGYSIEKIAYEFEREVDEVFLLLMDLSRKGEIKKRKNGILGK